MREAYLTGDTNAEETLPAEQAAPIFLFESVSLTEEFHVKLVGARYADSARDEFTITRNRVPHPDLLKALRRLTLHMCLLTETLTAEQLYPQTAGLLTDALAADLLLREAVETGMVYVHPMVENFRCLGVQWKTKGVILSGERKARYRCFGKSLEVKTPATVVQLHSDEDELEEGDYPFFEQMHNALGELTSECIAYMGGKYGELGEQLELFGKDPAPAAPRSIGQIVHDLLNHDLLSNDRYTVEVGLPGQPLQPLKKRKAKRTKVKGADSEEEGKEPA